MLYFDFTLFTTPPPKSGVKGVSYVNVWVENQPYAKNVRKTSYINY